jgi:hypothetical protein
MTSEAVTTWALRCGAKSPLAWTDAHEAILRQRDALWDDLLDEARASKRREWALEDATGDEALRSAQTELREAQAVCDAAFAARDRHRQAHRTRESTPEIEHAIGEACRRRRAARKALWAATKPVRATIRPALELEWAGRRKRENAIAAGKSRRYATLQFGDYNDVLDHFRTATRAAGKLGRFPQRAERHPSQSLHRQIPGGRTWAHLFESESEVLSLRPYSPGERVTRERWVLLRMAVSSDRLQIELPVRLDREPPPESRVQGVRVVRRGREWHVVFSLRAPVLTPIARPSGGTLYAGVNWRSLASGLRVLDGIDDAGRRVQVVLGREYGAEADYADFLQAALDRRAGEAADTLAARGHDVGEIVRRRDWPALRTAALSSGDDALAAWAHGEVRGAEIHTALLRARRAAGGDGEKQAHLVAQALGDRVGRAWVAGLQSKRVRRRTDLYRRCARWLAEHYARIVLAEVDLRKLAQLRDEETGAENDLPRAARRNRQIAAPYELESAITWATKRAGHEVEYVPAVDASHTCPLCGEEMERGASDRGALWLACRQHGAFDRDHVLGLNLWLADAPVDREHIVWHALQGQRSQAEIVNVAAAVEGRLRGHGRALSRVRYTSGTALANDPDSRGDSAC